MLHGSRKAIPGPVSPREADKKKAPVLCSNRGSLPGHMKVSPLPCDRVFFGLYPGGLWGYTRKAEGLYQGEGYYFNAGMVQTHALNQRGVGLQGLYCTIRHST